MPGAIKDDTLHPIKEGQVRRLYQLTMVQHALSQVLSSVQPAQSTEGLEPVSNKGPKEIYECFVNKLAQILDLKHGGDFVTAIAILQPGCIEYRISSNDRSKGEFHKATNFLKDNILVPLGQATDKELDDAKAEKEMRSSMLLKILEFARRRIIKYIRDLRGSLDRDQCLSECESEETEDARKMAPKLRELLSLAVTVDETFAKLGLAQQSSKAIINWGPFAKEANVLLQVIKTYWSSLSFERYLRAKCGPSRASRDQTSWGDLFHAIGRLHSYNIALHYFFEARRQWPILFEPNSLEVTYEPSAPKSPNPLQVKERLCTGKDIINRHFDREPEVVEAYQSLLPQLEELEFDKLLKEEIKSSSYHTVVHAEVNIADSLYREYRDPEQTSGVRFFNEAEFGRYIGCSKPTCLLCDYYLAEHPLRFRRRMGHGNMYHKWRPADIFKTVDQPGTRNLGAALAETRRKILEGVIREIRKTVSKTILDRTGSRSKYDSRHTPSDPMGMGVSRRGGSSVAWGSDYGSLYLAQAAGGGRGVLEDVREVTEGDSEEGAVSSVDDTTATLTGSMGRLTVVNGDGSGKRKGKEVWARNKVFEDDDEDEGGGVQLWGHAQ